MPSGLFEGLFGRLATGVSEERDRRRQQEDAELAAQIHLLDEYRKSPNARPEIMGKLLTDIIDLQQARTGSRKKKGGLAGFLGATELPISQVLSAIQAGEMDVSPQYTTEQSPVEGPDLMRLMSTATPASQPQAQQTAGLPAMSPAIHSATAAAPEVDRPSPPGTSGLNDAAAQVLQEPPIPSPPPLSSGPTKVTSTRRRQERPALLYSPEESAALAANAAQMEEYGKRYGNIKGSLDAATEFMGNEGGQIPPNFRQRLLNKLLLGSAGSEGTWTMRPFIRRDDPQQETVFLQYNNVSQELQDGMGNIVNLADYTPDPKYRSQIIFNDQGLPQLVYYQDRPPVSSTITGGPVVQDVPAQGRKTPNMIVPTTRPGGVSGYAGISRTDPSATPVDVPEPDGSYFGRVPTNEASRLAQTEQIKKAVGQLRALTASLYSNRQFSTPAGERAFRTGEFLWRGATDPEFNKTMLTLRATAQRELTRVQRVYALDVANVAVQEANRILDTLDPARGFIPPTRAAALQVLDDFERALEEVIEEGLRRLDEGSIRPRGGGGIGDPDTDIINEYLNPNFVPPAPQ